MGFDKSAASFPVKEQCVYLTHCGVAPMYSGAAEEIQRFTEARVRLGARVFETFGNPLTGLHRSLGTLLGTSPANVSFMKNTAEAMSLIAAGYPFEPGDEIISYVHEYPSNFYPWHIQEERGVSVKLLPDSDPLGDLPADSPRGWSMEDLAGLVTDRTRIVTVSHVQFTSGFAADLKTLGTFCHERGIDLVVDAAQSLGSLPVEPERCNIAAIAASGWKWMLGPLGSGVMYTSPEFRDKIAVTVAGADMVTQGEDYLDHRWQPYTDGRRFEYSTTQCSYAAALRRSLDDLFLQYGAGDIRDEIFRLQDVFLDALDRDRCRPVVWPEPHRSGILSLIPSGDPERLARRMTGKGVTVTARGGYLRIAPHFYNDEEEMVRAAGMVNEMAGDS